jgi:hypothetical protein
MTMKTRLAAICLILSFVLQARAEELSRLPNASAGSSASPAKARAVSQVWPHEASDLKPDANAVWGKLDNGMRYVSLPAPSAPGRFPDGNRETAGHCPLPGAHGL